MRVEVNLTTDAANLEMTGTLINMEVGERGELSVLAHGTDGTVEDVMLCAPGEWRHGRWVDRPTRETVEAYKRWTQEQEARHHGRPGRGGFL